MKSSLKQQFMRLKSKKQEAVSSKTFHNLSTSQAPKVSKTKDPFKKSTSANLFKNITFCFPHFDIQLTKKQSEIISKQITQQQGKVIQFHDHLYLEPVEYVLASSKARPQNIQKKIEGRLNYVDILDYNYVTCCVEAEEQLDPSPFSLLNKEKTEQKQQKNTQSKKKRKSSENLSQKKQVKEKIQPQEINEQNRSLTQQLLEKEDDSDPQEKRYGKVDKNKFFCQKGKENQKPAMNKFIEQELLQLQKIYANERDIGRRIAYGKAASIIRTWKESIKTEADVDKIAGIGPKIRDKIKEIVSTGKLRKLDQFNQSEQVQALGELSKVWGIGPAKARELYNNGIKSIEQLRKNQQSLTKNQKIGLKYFEDFEQRIPRQKVGRMFEYVLNTLRQIGEDPDVYKCQCCGSYRRGKTTCGDMDIIITRKDGKVEKDLLVKLVSALEKKKFLTDNLSEPKATETHSSTSYMGVCQFQDSVHCRIDIKFYPLQEYAFALLYFTGSGMFNRSMRLYASTLGLQLSDKGFARKPEKKGVYWSQPIPVCYTEEDVFKVLGLDYKTPKERDD